jgi:hypothetical protein
MSTPLRKLAQEHAAGKLDVAEYRRQRRVLLHQLTEHPAGPRAARVIRAALKPGSQSARFLRVALIWLVLAAVALSLQWQSRQDNPINSFQRVAQAILSDPTWGSDELEHLSAEWHGLSAEQQDRARAAVWYPDLIGALARRAQRLDERLETLDSDVIAQAIRLDSLVSELQSRVGRDAGS